MADVNATLYRCHLTHLVSTYEAHPYGFDGMDVEGHREGDSVYVRRFVSGKFIFINNPRRGWYDFDWIKAIEDGADSCSKISVRIDRSCDGGVTYVPFWSGKFTTSDGTFDLDKCQFVTDIDVDDIYQCILDGSNDDFNIISLPNEYEVIYNGAQSGLEFDTVVSGGQYTAIGAFTCVVAYANIYWREYKYTQCVAGAPVAPAGAGWFLEDDDCATTGLAKWVRIPLDTPPTPSTDFYCSDCTAGVPNEPLVPACDRWTLVFSDCGLDISIWWCRPDPAPAGTYTHCRLLEDVVLGVAQSACSDITSFVSDFFEINPVGDAPGYVAGINYVTGSASQLLDLFISQKSDILLPSATQPATDGPITFNQLMSFLKSEFNVYWWITGGTILRIEHISYFSYNVEADFTVNPYARQLRGTNIYSRIQDKRPRKEIFKWMEAFGVDFIGYPILYNFDCVRRAVGVPRGGRGDEFIDNSVTYSVDKITTDIDFITSSPSEISSEGFVMFSTTPDGLGSYLVNSEVGLVSGNLIPNGHLSWANLHYNYHRHNRVLLAGTMNNISETFFTAKPTKQQDKVIVSECCDGIDDLAKNNEIIGTIKTNIGFGMIDNYKKNLKNDSITFKLLY